MSHRALNPEQFHYVFNQAKPRSMEGPRHHELRVYAGGTMSIGQLMWHHKTGEIGNINVSPEVRRQGVATAMLGHARQLASETRGVRSPRHSSDRTESGEAWARSLGERLPKRLQLQGRASGDWEPA